MNKFLLLFLLFLSLNCKEKENNLSAITYDAKQAYVNAIDIAFDYNRRKSIDLTITVLNDNTNIHQVLKIKNTNFKCKVGDPIVLMINPQDAKDIWISHKQIIDKNILKAYLKKNNLKLSSFFENQL